MANVGFRIKQIITALRIPGGYQGEHDDSSSGLAIFTSIMAALLIWFMISMQESYSIVRDFPVTVVKRRTKRAAYWGRSLAELAGGFTS